MLKRCNDALRVACALALVLALVPSSAFAQNDVRLDGSEPTASATMPTNGMTEAAPDLSEVQVTDVSKLARVSDEAAQTLEGYFDARADEVAKGKPASADDSIDLSRKVGETSDERAASFGQMQDDANISITDADTTVSVSSVTESGSKVKVRAYEQTVFTYDDLADGKGGSDVAIFGTEHTVTLDTGDGGTTIKSDAYDESDLSGIDTTGSAPSTDARADSAGASSDAAAAGPAPASRGEEAGQPQGVVGSFLSQVAGLVFPPKAEAAAYSYDSNYDVAKAIAYADRYWTSYNTKYRNFNPVGGDCANFVSQCMKAGKLNQKRSGTNAWYYNSASDYSESWTYCPTMVKALKSRGKYYYIKKADLATEESASKIFPGSPVIYRNSAGTYYHAVICTGYNSAGTPVISAHNNDRYHVPYTYAGNACATIQLTATAPGTTFTTPDGSWQVGSDNETAVLTKFNSPATTFSVPATVESNGKSLTVTNFTGAAFQGNAALEEITVDGTVTAIPEGAFRDCTALRKVSIGPSVRTIGKYAFSGCKKLEELSGCASVTKVGGYAFDGCKKLPSVSVLGKVTSIGKRSFRGCTSLAKLTGLGALKSVGTEAFRGCSKLSKVSGLPVLTKIGSGAFRSCGSLTSVHLASPSLASIGSWAFCQDAALSKLKIASALLSVEGVGKKAFAGTPEKPKVYVPSQQRKAYKTVFVARGLSPKAKIKKY